MASAKTQNFISNVRDAATGFNQKIDQFNALKRQYDALDLGNVLTDEDFAGANEGITASDLKNAIALIDGVLKGLPEGSSTVLFKITN